MRNLAYRNFYIGDLRIEGTNIHARNGPECPEIIINAELDLVSYETREEPLGNDGEEREQFPYTVTDLTGDLKLKTEPGSRSKTRPLCRLQSDFDPRHVDRKRNYTPTFEGRLTPHHVNELEKHRQGNDLHLQVSCMLSLHFRNPPSEPKRFARVSEEIDVTIPRSRWTDNVYPDLGGREVFVIEIPKGKQSIEAAWTKIDDAKDAYHNWNTEGASIACREAADAMDRAVKEHVGKDSCTYTERWQRAYDGVKHQASLAGHLQKIKNEANCERPEDLRVGQVDLECLIIRTQSLLKYAEALLREGKE
jgi:hypothetical protein